MMSDRKCTLTPFSFPLTPFSFRSRSSPLFRSSSGLDLHQLKGARKGTWAVKVSANWRLTFRFVGKDADAVDYEDYH